MRRYLFLLLTLSLSARAQSWLPHGNGITNETSTGSPYVFSLLTDTIDNILYAGGMFDSAGGKLSANLASWNGSTWQQFGTQGTGVEVRAMIKYKGKLYIGGGVIHQILVWNDTVPQWL